MILISMRMQICNLLVDGFGKRNLGELHKDRFGRNVHVELDCCTTDLCNMPHTSTSTTSSTTTMPNTTSTSTATSTTTATTTSTTQKPTTFPRSTTSRPTTSTTTPTTKQMTTTTSSSIGRKCNWLYTVDQSKSVGPFSQVQITRNANLICT